MYSLTFQARLRQIENDLLEIWEKHEDFRLDTTEYFIVKCPECKKRLKVQTGGGGRYESDDYDIRVKYCSICGKRFDVIETFCTKSTYRCAE